MKNLQKEKRLQKTLKTLFGRFQKNKKLFYQNERKQLKIQKNKKQDTEIQE